MEVAAISVRMREQTTHRSRDKSQVASGRPLQYCAVAAQQLRLQLAKQLEVIGRDGGARVLGERGKRRKRREELRDCESVGFSHDHQLPMQSLDEEQRIVIAACSTVRRRGEQVAMPILNSSGS